LQQERELSFFLGIARHTSAGLVRQTRSVRRIALPARQSECRAHKLRTIRGRIVGAELRELASPRDAGIRTEEEFNAQKQRLLPQ
jgi:hypothetical protein